MKFLLLTLLVLIVKSQDYEYDYEFADDYGNIPIVRPIVKKKRGRVVGGTDARIEEFPFYVNFKRNFRPFCGGTILDETHILTAAHCKIRAGDTVTYGTDVRSTRENVISVSSAVAHPDVSEIGVWWMDYQIATLSSPIPFSNKAKVVEFGSESEFDNMVKKGQAQCVVTGMGRAGKGGSKVYKEKLQKGEQTYVPSGCAMYYRSKGPDPKVNNCFLTTGKGKVSGCPGDSGGPLFCKISGSWKQFGVASFAQVSCNGNTGWWSPIAVKDWIAKNSNFKGVTSSRSSSSSSTATKQSYSARPNTSPTQQSFKRPQNYKPRPNYSRPSYSPPQSSRPQYSSYANNRFGSNDKRPYSRPNSVSNQYKPFSRNYGKQQSSSPRYNRYSPPKKSFGRPSSTPKYSSKYTPPRRTSSAPNTRYSGRSRNTASPAGRSSDTGGTQLCNIIYQIRCISANTLRCQKDSRGRHYDKCICKAGWAGGNCGTKKFW